MSNGRILFIAARGCIGSWKDDMSTAEQDASISITVLKTTRLEEDDEKKRKKEKEKEWYHKNEIGVLWPQTTTGVAMRNHPKGMRSHEKESTASGIAWKWTTNRY